MGASSIALDSAGSSAIFFVRPRAPARVAVRGLVEVWGPLSDHLCDRPRTGTRSGRRDPRKLVQLHILNRPVVGGV